MVCPYKKGTPEAKAFMANLRSMRGKGGKYVSQKTRKRKGGLSFGTFVKRVFSAIKNPDNRQGDLKDRYRHFANDVTGKTEARQRREEILNTKMNRHQRDLLKRGIWISEIDNGIPYEYFQKMKAKGQIRGGFAVPTFLIKLIGKLGISAALAYFNRMSAKAQEAAWRGSGGAWIGPDGELHAVKNPMMVGSVRPKKKGGATLMQPHPIPKWGKKMHLTEQDARNAILNYYNRYGGKSIKDVLKNYEKINLKPLPLDAVFQGPEYSAYI